MKEYFFFGRCQLKKNKINKKCKKINQNGDQNGYHRKNLKENAELEVPGNNSTSGA